MRKVSRGNARRREIKQKAVELLGGKCQVCGYDKCLRALQFHHVNPKEKSFQVSAADATRRWERIKEELAKCVLLCANCHAEEEDRILLCSSSGRTTVS